MSSMRADPSQGAAARGMLAANACKAITLHFEKEGFDAFKYNFKAGIKPAQYERRRDRYFFEKLGMKYRGEWELRHFFLANVISGVTFAGDMSEDNLISWQAHIQSMSYRFEQDMKLLKRLADTYDYNFNELLKPTAVHGFSLVVEKLLENDLSYESVVALNTLVGFIQPLKRQVNSDPLGIFADVSHRVVKYEPFIRPLVKIDRLRAVVLKTFSSKTA